jgi:hypothetical protein
MPVILIERIPLPSLRTYTAISVALLACALYYAHNTAVNPENFATPHLHPVTVSGSDGGAHTSNDERNASLNSDAALNSRDATASALNPDVNLSDVVTKSETMESLSREEYLENLLFVLINEGWCIWVCQFCCCTAARRYLISLSAREYGSFKVGHFPDIAECSLLLWLHVLFFHCRP